MNSKADCWATQACWFLCIWFQIAWAFLLIKHTSFHFTKILPFNRADYLKIIRTHLLHTIIKSTLLPHSHTHIKTYSYKHSHLKEKKSSHTHYTSYHKFYWMYIKKNVYWSNLEQYTHLLFLNHRYQVITRMQHWTRLYN